MKTQVFKKPALSQLLRQKEQFLSVSEVENLDLISEIRVYDYLAGRYALKTLFVSMFEDNIKSTDVSVTSQNKKLKINYGDTDYNCSISHSKEYVACSIDKSNQNGIDVEELKPRSPELQKYIMNHTESSYFDIDEQFLTTRVWSIKEAAFKSDTNQILITNYAICDRNNDLFLVQNLQTRKIIWVKNQVIDNYTVSYTIPSTI